MLPVLFLTASLSVIPDPPPVRAGSWLPPKRKVEERKKSEKKDVPPGGQIRVGDDARHVLAVPQTMPQCDCGGGCQCGPACPRCPTKE
jgi:hypothetical protein